MNRRFLVIIFVLATGILITFTAFLFWSGGEHIGNKYLYKDKNGGVVEPVSFDEELLQKIKTLPLRKRIGQLMIFGFSSTTPDAHIRELIEGYGVGGVNLLKRNVANATQVKKMAGELQSLTEEAGLPPMFIAVDQEGGEVNRFKFLSEKTAQMEMGSMEEAFGVARRRGGELKNLGITMNFSPVLDYVPNTSAYLYNRTFATTSDASVELGVAMAKGYLDVGIIPVFKHFPGYGSIALDPHQNTALISDKEFLEKSLLVFERALSAKPDVPIMTAHIIYPNFDSKPATLSKKFLTTILRGRFGYKGVIITDDIEMVSARLAKSMSIPEASVQALEAGVDIVISTYTTSLHEKIIKAIEEAVANGRLSENRINESVVRVWKLKMGAFDKI